MNHPFTDNELIEMAETCIYAFEIGIHSKGECAEEEPLYKKCLDWRNKRNGIE